MFSTTDTIVAIATPPGRGGIGIVRLSGPRAHDIAVQLLHRNAPLDARRATFATLTPSGDTARSAVPLSPDHVIVTYFRGPQSYTGEDVIEISAHGSPVVLNGIVSATAALGARLAAPGEFTLRAFLNGRVDLMQAEAVVDLIDAATPLQARVAFDQLNGTLTRAIGEIDETLFDLIARLEASVDFPDEGYHFVEPGALALGIRSLEARIERLLADAGRGRLIREGLQVAIVGPPNVGKSSLFNALVGTSRAIVTDVAGTTRDLITETVDIHGVRVTLVDTAGLRSSPDPIEVEGVSRSRGAADVADLILDVADLSQTLGDQQSDIFIEVSDDKRLIVATKADLPARWSRPGVIEVSSLTGIGLDRLRQRIVDSLDTELQAERPAITNVRHIVLMQRAAAALSRAAAAADQDGRAMPEEFVLADLQDARASLEEITGRRTPDDVLAHIFSKFCIGK